MVEHDRVEIIESFELPTYLTKVVNGKLVTLNTGVTKLMKGWRGTIISINAHYCILELSDLRHRNRIVTLKDEEISKIKKI